MQPPRNLNLFPAVVQLRRPGQRPRTVTSLRLVVTDGRARLYAPSRACRDCERVDARGRVVVLAEGELVAASGSTYTLQPDDGSEPLAVTRGGGCGCGSPLKSWSPPGPAKVGG